MMMGDGYCVGADDDKEHGIVPPRFELCVLVCLVLLHSWGKASCH